jgi:excisionase family DNA binding protein
MADIKDVNWMTIEETADYLRCSLRYLRDKVANREIPFTQFAGKALFHKSRIDEWMFSQEEPVSDVNASESDSTEIDTTIKSDCDREKIDGLIQELIDFAEHFVSGLGNNLKADLEENDYQCLSEKVYAQLSRWCHPNRNTKREQRAKPIAQKISEALYGNVIQRTKHPSYRG